MARWNDLPRPEVDAAPAIGIVEPMKPTARALSLLIATLVLSTGSLALARTGAEPGSLPPALRATGGAGVAAVTGLGSLFANPAAMGMQPGQSIELGFARDQRPGRSTFSLGSVDGNRGQIAGGSAYAYEFGDTVDGRERSGYDWRSGVSFGLKGETAGLLLGGTVRRMSMDWAAGAGQAKRTVEGWTGDVGLLLVLGEYIRLGAVWQNVKTLGSDEAPSMLAGGLGITAGPVLIAADTRFRTTDWEPNWAVGAQFGIAQVAIIRAGWRMDRGAQAQHLITGGLGVRIERYGFDASFEIDPKVPSRWQLGISVVLGLPYVGG